MPKFTKKHKSKIVLQKSVKFGIDFTQATTFYKTSGGKVVPLCNSGGGIAFWSQINKLLTFINPVLAY